MQQERKIHENILISPTTEGDNNPKASNENQLMEDLWPHDPQPEQPAQAAEKVEGSDEDLGDNVDLF